MKHRGRHKVKPRMFARGQNVQRMSRDGGWRKQELASQQTKNLEKKLNPTQKRYILCYNLRYIPRGGNKMITEQENFGRTAQSHCGGHQRRERGEFAGPRGWFDRRFAGFRERGESRHGGFGAGRERGFGRGGERLFDAGDVRLVVLKLLSEQPSYGYQLIKTMEQRLGGGYTPSAGVIYPTLTMLEEEGLASVSTSGRERIPSGQQGADRRIVRASGYGGTWFPAWPVAGNHAGLHEFARRGRGASASRECDA